MSIDANPQPIDEVTAEAADEQFVEEAGDAYAPRLTVADGFRFGCGLILASLAFLFIAIIVAAVVILLAVLLNFPLPFGLG